MHFEAISLIIYITIINKKIFQKTCDGKEPSVVYGMVLVKLNGHCPAGNGGYSFLSSGVADFSHVLSKTSLTVSSFQERPKLFIYISTSAPSVFLRWRSIVTIAINTGQKDAEGSVERTLEVS